MDCSSGPGHISTILASLSWCFSGSTWTSGFSGLVDQSGSEVWHPVCELGTVQGAL